MKRLNYTVYRNGDYFRKLAKESGMDVTKFNEYVKDHPEIDRKIENSASEYAKDHDNFIIDARLGWYAVPQSFKVYLKVDIDIATKRVYEDEARRDSERKFDTLEEQKNDIIKRYKLENERYFELYGVRKQDENNYDFVLDTSMLTPEEVADKIETEYKKWLEE